jgi:hypothetical protein
VADERARERTVSTEPWTDEAAGRIVRPFAVAGGRTRPGRFDLNLITLVVAVGRPERHRNDPEYAEIMRCCAHPMSVAEVAATVDLPLGVVKVLLSDLIERGDLIFRMPVHNVHGRPDDPALLRAVLDGIRRL